MWPFKSKAQKQKEKEEEERKWQEKRRKLMTTTPVKVEQKSSDLFDVTNPASPLHVWNAPIVDDTPSRQSAPDPVETSRSSDHHYSSPSYHDSGSSYDSSSHSSDSSSYDSGSSFDGGSSGGSDF